MSAQRVLETMLKSVPRASAHDSISAWWRAHCEATEGYGDPVDRALIGGFFQDRLGFAFASGFHSALLALVPEVGGRHRTAFCASEAHGAHPRQIATTLRPAERGFVLSGLKSWCTLGTFAAGLLVVAKQGEAAGGRSVLRLVRVQSDAPGVKLTAMPETPFVPEVPHASVGLSDVWVPEQSVLPGDGYADYVKPFRTVEDIHVHAALLGYLLGAARRKGFPCGFMGRLAEAVVTARALSQMDPKSACTHVALSGFIATSKRTVEEAGECFNAAQDDEEAVRWRRDLPLLDIAKQARKKRGHRAWERLLEPSAPA